MIRGIIWVASALGLGACAQYVVTPPQPAASPATTTQPPSVTSAPPVAQRGADSGVKQKLYSYMFVNPDCSSAELPRLKLTVPPVNGSVTFENGDDYPNFAKDNVRNVCNGRKLPAIIVYYTSNPGFVGVDHLTIQPLYSGGGFRDDVYSVTVR